jgi:hypothetical protein
MFSLSKERDFIMFENNFPDNLVVFRTRFYDALAKMLMADELGAFILVLANSLQDTSLQSGLSRPLKEKFKRIKNQFDNKKLIAVKDDYDVFTALITLGLDNLSVWQYRTTQAWSLVYNPMRALRPARSSSEVISRLKHPFNPDGFHFNKPFLVPEIFWQGELNAVEVKVLYNKFPFVPYHLLIVPDYNQCLPQCLTKKYHDFIWEFVMQYSVGLTGLGVAYNSLGAYASINQLHFQGFIQEDVLPIEDLSWQHNGGEALYPVECKKCTDVDEAWEMIQHYHEVVRAYNLLYRTNCCYVIARKFQGEVALPDWMQGMAWYEVCGIQALGDNRLFNALDSLQLTQILSIANTKN